MGKWTLVALMCLMVVLLACPLAFGQEMYGSQPVATANPGQLIQSPQGAPQVTAPAQSPITVTQTVNTGGSTAAGHAGRNGRNGANGAAGRDGREGLNGRDGRDGLNGRDASVLYVGQNGQFAAASGNVILTPVPTQSLIQGIPNGWLLFGIIVIALAILGRNAIRSWARREERRENNAPAIVAANRISMELPAVPDPIGPSEGESMAIHRDSSGVITGIERHRWPLRTAVHQLAPGQAVATINHAGQISVQQADFPPQPEMHLHLHGLPQPGPGAVAIAIAARREELERQREEAARPPAPVAAEQQPPDAAAAGAAAGREAGGGEAA